MTKRLHFISLPSKYDTTDAVSLGTITATFAELRDAMGEPSTPLDDVYHWIREVDDILVIVRSTDVVDEWDVASNNELALQYLTEALAERKLPGF